MPNVQKALVSLDLAMVGLKRDFDSSVNFSELRLHDIEQKADHIIGMLQSLDARFQVDRVLAPLVQGVAGKVAEKDDGADSGGAVPKRSDAPGRASPIDAT